MVRNYLSYRGIKDKRVLKAMAKVPRHLFVSDEYRSLAYSDRPLPIGFGQTISQPFIVAKMAEILELKGKEKVLDVGTGSGYQAAVLSLLADRVYSLEIKKPLAERAKEKLERLGYSNVEVINRDGSQGLKDKSPFDAIVSAAASKQIPDSWKRQLSWGGRIVAPLGGSRGQKLVRLTKSKSGFEKEQFGVVAFVPLVTG